ncbi:MAG TPA: helix-turn-helix domain-containing protein [Actinomycetota bacterium]|nr:helix-turn-helix domain-containing protein [Actinomycetota bacterium]
MLDSMSSENSTTRERILTAARSLLEEQPGATVTMGQIAERAGVSRQALYLHFADRGSLFLEIGRMVDAMERTPERQRRVDEAATAREALREAIALQAYLKPKLQGLTTAIDVLRRTDPAADAAWREREHARLQRCEDLVRRLASEGDLRAGWDAHGAAQCLWAVTSQRVWDDLVVDQGWSTDKYCSHLTRLLEAALFN